MTTALEVIGRRDLRRLEGVIRRGLATFREVGAALLEIRDRRLYRATHASFEAYCRERWDFSRQRAHQLIQASRVAGELSRVVDTLPANEAQARALAGVPEEDRAAVWEQALAGIDGTPTAEEIEEIAAEALEGLDPEAQARVVNAAEEAARRREAAREEREAEDSHKLRYEKADALFGKLLRVLGQEPGWVSVRRAVRRARERLRAKEGIAD